MSTSHTNPSTNTSMSSPQKTTWKSPAYTPSQPRDDDPVEYKVTPPIYSPAWHPPSYYAKKNYGPKPYFTNPAAHLRQPNVGFE